MRRSCHYCAIPGFPLYLGIPLFSSQVINIPNEVVIDAYEFLFFSPSNPMEMRAKLGFQNRIKKFR